MRSTLLYLGPFSQAQARRSTVAQQLTCLPAAALIAYIGSRHSTISPGFGAEATGSSAGIRLSPRTSGTQCCIRFHYPLQFCMCYNCETGNKTRMQASGRLNVRLINYRRTSSVPLTCQQRRHRPHVTSPYAAPEPAPMESMILVAWR